MVPSESVEQNDDLIGAIAATLNILGESFAEEGTAVFGAATLAPLAEEVGRIAAVAVERGLLGLHDACLLFQEQLLALVTRGCPLSGEEWELLEEWPTLAVGYAQALGDADASAALVAHLQHPDWGSPLPEEEAASLRSFLLLPALGGRKTEPEETTEVPREDGHGSVTLSEVLVSAYLETGLEEIGAPDAASETVKADLAESVATPAISLSPQAETESPAPLASVLPASTAEDGDLLSAAFPLEESESSATPAPPERMEFADDEADREEITTKAGLALAAEDPSDQALPISEAEVSANSAASELPPAAQEIFALLAAEVATLQEGLMDSLQVAGEADTTALTTILADQAEHLENLAEAALGVGLEGLSQACRHIHANILKFVAEPRQVDASRRRLLRQWPEPVLVYLAAPRLVLGCHALADYLRDARWPEALSAEAADRLEQSLVAAEIKLEEEQPEARPREARPEDVSLALPKDANLELLESLLQELPGQTAEFSAGLQRIIGGNGSREDIDSAKRIAHTIKGAANTVGVKGIATLTHYLEDILIAFSKAGVTPSGPLAETLSSAADCLAAMSEALLGMGEPPPDSLAVLQQVLDWANLIDREGISQPQIRSRDELGFQWQPPQPAAQPAAPTQAAPEPGPAQTVAMLRVPMRLIDDTLRLLGETIILSGQLRDQVLRASRQTRSIREHHLMLQQLSAELEQLVDIRGLRSPVAQQPHQGLFDPLEMEEYNELHTIGRRLIEAATDARELNEELTRGLAQLNELLGQQGQLHRDVEETLMRGRMVPVQTLVSRMERSVRQTCRLTDKEAELQVMGAQLLVDSNVLNDLVDPLMHLLRNAVDHGIETPSTREAAGKSRQGRIGLEFAREGSYIVVRCRDDGAGLDFEAIRRKAEESGLIRRGQTLSEDDLARLILLPGFSTRGEATQVSGRGIGMDMVYARILEMKGSLRLRSAPSTGLLVELKLPVTLMTTHGLLARIGKQIVAISSRGLESIVYSSDGQLSQIGSQLVCRLGEGFYPVTSLEALLGLPSDQRKSERGARPALLVQDDTGKRHLIMVQELIDSRELVVKTMGKYLSGIRGTLGATILGDGSVTVLLDLPELLRRPVNIERPHLAAQAVPSVQVKRPIALVVDDSLSARRALAQFLQDSGFEVRTARDGLEAANLLQTLHVDILLVDMEMPRMNGLELTAHVRGHTETRHLPVIMVTSRSTEKHRSQATAAGVNAYLVKPFAETELLQQVNALTSVRGAA